jgi:hypothetical protein
MADGRRQLAITRGALACPALALAIEVAHP